MRIGQYAFRGEAPRITPRALPETAAQEATNARLQTGDLESWRQFAETQSLIAPFGQDIQTIYLLDDAWLSWTRQVDVARGVIPGDDTFRIYLTSPDIYPTVRWTNLELATEGVAPYPVTTRPVGVPAAETAPTLVLGVDSTPTTYSIDVTDAGDELDTGWITSAPGDGDGLFTRVEQDAVEGNPAPSYKLTYDEVHQPTQGAYAYRNFGIRDSTFVKAVADFEFTDDLGRRVAGLAVATTAEGVGLVVLVHGNTLQIRNSTTAGWFGSALVDSVSISGGTTGSNWYTMEVTVNAKPDGTQTVTARVLDGVTELATVTATAAFGVQDCVGIIAQDGADASSRYVTRFDNIRVQASGSTGLVAVNTATAYLYTLVNDLGEEGPPSPVSAEVLRPSGVSVTVTTPTTAPTDDENYFIAKKRIYRAVSGATGDVFLLVAEIDLGTADYVDTLGDDEIGPDVLESEEWDLPPADLQGIIVLPNGMLAGFRRNQLCVCVPSRPHAWRVRDRLTTDTDIVAICNLDNTIVIGTKSFVYTATGNAGESYSMSKPGAAQACVAKLSMTYLEGVGVVFASPDGVQACAGSAGAVRNITEGIYTKKQWEALNPESLVAAVHDNVLHCWYDTEYVPVTGPLPVVLVLFHNVDPSNLAEGEQEFGESGVDITAVDQTGAAWEFVDVDFPENWVLTDTPTPPIGEFAHGAPPATEIATQAFWQRTEDQGGAVGRSGSSLSMDMWVYIADDAQGELSFQIGQQSGGGFLLRVSSIGIIQGGFATEGFISAGNTPWITDEWVHLRLVYDGEFIRFWVNGTLIGTSSSVPDLTDVTTFNAMFLQLRNEAEGSIGMFWDEAFGVLNYELTVGAGNFTPPTAPWTLNIV